MWNATDDKRLKESLMRVITDKELLQLQLDILKKVDTFCRNNGIQYTVFAGTCIGTVRHKGYIPWDDDIDIAMTRPNYDRFIHLFNGKVEYLEVYAPELNWDYYAPYANVCDTRTILDEGSNGHRGQSIGVKIDVFPIDGVASDIIVYHHDKKVLALYWKILYAKRILLSKKWTGNKKAAIAVLIKRFFSIHKSYAAIQKAIRKKLLDHSYDKSEYVDLMCYPWPTDSRCPKSVFENYVDMQFEDIKVSIIKEYDEYLTKAYGRYMELPPEEKRIPRHGFNAYWKDLSKC